MGRDFYNQVPSKMLICCATPLANGQVSGGTNMAWSYMKYVLGLPVYNIRVKEDLDKILSIIR